ncbi:CDK10 isoform 18 [Pan troglodytes]|uniref:Cyclin dependent kinase 10 n=2 Tax=Homininae TaxID=207598 RepID=D6RA59_HUMAN|nr:CDK10 isoform 18 [Pan troglodytes]
MAEPDLECEQIRLKCIRSSALAQAGMQWRDHGSVHRQPPGLK